MAKSGYKGISRIDQPSRQTFGWYVRVMFKGTTRCKFFSDKVSGSKREALEAAIKYRDESEAELGRPRTDRLVSSGSGRNESGVTGVNIQRRIVRASEGERVIKKYFVVNWSPWPGKTCREFVSIEKHGERGRAVESVPDKEGEGARDVRE